MRYRALTVGQVHDIVEVLATGERFGVDAVALERGDGELLNEAALLEILAEFTSALEGGDIGDGEMFEGRIAAALHPWFSAIPIEVLDDPGFWRYLAVRHFWWYTSRRESGPISEGNYKNLVDATRPAEQVPLRMYLRTRAVDVDGDVALAGEIPKSTDFWRSHITRVRVGSAPRVARTFAEAKRDDRKGKLKTDPLRRVARRLNRTWANTNLDVYGDEDASALINEIIEEET